MILIVATVGIVFGLLFGVTTCAHDSAVRDQCDREASRAGFNASEKETVVQFCVKNADGFMSSSRSVLLPPRSHSY